MHDDFAAAELPTWTEILRHAHDELSAARIALSTDVRITVQDVIGELKGAIDRAKDVLAGALDETDE